MLAGIVEKRLADTDAPACIAAAVVDGDVRMHFAASEGIAQPARLSGDSIFEIGSITKAFTGLLLAEMVRREEVSLDDQAAKHARPGARLPREGITLRELATHTSGLPRLPPQFAPADESDPYKDFDADALYDALARTRGRRPGPYEYSNFGYMWLTDLLARAGRGPFGELLHARVLAPLGLNDAALELNEARSRRFVHGHEGDYRPARAWEFPEAIAGVGGLRASLDDLVRFAQAAAGRLETPLDAAFAIALQPIAPIRKGESVGLAWHAIERKGTRLHWHNGGTGGATAMIAVDRAARRAAVVLSDNAEASFDDLALHLLAPQFPLRRRQLFAWPSFR